ncbi:MAG: FMN-binding negative transcriptional regulator [Clostridia bacterium]
MYIPSHFAETDKQTLFDFMEANSFAILFSQKDGVPQASHLPFLLDREEECLYGHMAIANGHWRDASGEVMVVFSGAHAYISPSWYQEKAAVPTWNYTAVHAYGTFEQVKAEELPPILAKSVEQYESTFAEPWRLEDADPEYVGKMSKAIVGFRIKLSKLEGKWKLNQNHSRERQERVVVALKAQGDENSLQIAQLMEDNLKK